MNPFCRADPARIPALRHAPRAPHAPDSTHAHHPRISVVVLTHNRVQEVCATVGALLALPERPAVIVVDIASTDDTVAGLARHFPALDIVIAPANLGAAGRNLGVARVTTEFVAFCDDDTCWSPGSLERAVRLFDGYPRVGVLSARVVVGSNRTIDETCLRMRSSPLPSTGLPGPALVGFMAGASIFRTALYRAVGGYEPRLFIGGEETLVALDVLARHYAIAYAHELELHHRPSALRDSALRRRMLARNAAWVAWLRLPAAEALGSTWRALRVLRRENASWRARCRDAAALLRGLPWALARRAVIAREIQKLRDLVRMHEAGGDVPRQTGPGAL
jgi:GT2 family glycosyltransferase